MASGKSMGMQVGLIISVMLVLILGVVTCVQCDEGAKIRADLLTRTDEGGKEKSVYGQ